MLIRLASDKDEKKWNSFVSQHPQSSPYHHFGWKKSIEKAYSHPCHYLIAENSSDEIIGVLPTVAIAPPFFPGKLCALPFCDFGAGLTTEASVESLLIDEANKIAMQHKLPVFEYRASHQHLPDELLSKENKVRMLLELPETSEALMDGFKTKLRSQIKKAIKNGLTVELGKSDQFIDEFYDVFSFNMKALGSPTHSKNWFSEIRNNYADDMIISIVKYEGLPIGAGIVLFNGSMAAIPWASTRREYNRLSPNMLLYWSLLEYSTDNSYKTFDFGRSSFGEGTFRFKQQWGTKPVPLLWKKFSNGRLEKPSQSNKTTARKYSARSSVEAFWRKLPLPLTIAIGPKIRKYISL
ncbi:MAG TPA: FemAB family PEP-CTERM system-associated protein [Gammaproteobacteria bacterium]|nr:FemAB family PEP-CTERM system-associated protein [Gammaproteobacteria bacterium]